MKKTILLLFLLGSVFTYGQISITYSDYQEAFGAGSTYLSYTTPLESAGVSIFVGEPSGIAQSWDFTDYSFDYIARSVGIVASTAPMINEFPGSNLVLYEKSWLLKADTFYNWNYKELQTDRLLIRGLSDESSVLINYDPPAIQAVVPLTYGSNWLRDRDSTYIMAEFYTISESWVTVDGFGTMKLPSGTYPCLRLTQDHLTIAHTPKGIDSVWLKSYHFYSNGLIEVNLPSIMEDQFNLSTIFVPSFKYSKREGQVGLAENDFNLQGVQLEQNTPNPFHSQTMIRYNIRSGDRVVLRIFDFLGKEVTTLVDEFQTAGNHEVVFNSQGLPSGVYYYQLTSGNASITKRMVISR